MSYSVILSTDDGLENDEPEEYVSPYDVPDVPEYYNDNYDDEE